jgi:hypothetical protein
MMLFQSVTRMRNYPTSPGIVIQATPEIAIQRRGIRNYPSRCQALQPHCEPYLYGWNAVLGACRFTVSKAAVASVPAATSVTSAETVHQTLQNQGFDGLFVGCFLCSCAATRPPRPSI